MRLSLIFMLGLLGLLGVPPAAAQERFEVGGQFGYGAFLEDDSSGARPLAGGHFGFRMNDKHSLLLEYTQFRRNNDFGHRLRHNLFGVTLHTEPRPWNRVRVWSDLGAGAGVRTERYEARLEVPAFSAPSQTFVAVYGGAGVAFDVGERGFIRAGVRAYLWVPIVAIGLAPLITAGFRF